MIYQRGADGYPVGATPEIRKEYGVIPKETEFFNFKTNKFEVPEKVLGWEFSVFRFRWGAYVRFKGGDGQSFCFPKKLYIDTKRPKDGTEELGW